MAKVKRRMSLLTICLPVQAELKDVEVALARSTTSEVELVSSAAQYVLANGGKRVRPALLLLTAKMLGVQSSKAISLAAAIEMIHAASLMHDDVLDNASLRRGKPSANVKWGNQISILVGDFLWCRASEIAIKDGNSKILSSITSAVKETTEGEILEMVRSSDFNLSEEEYLKIIKLKTAMLFSCACHVGALLASASERSGETMRSFGLNLGIAFQLADDVLDYNSKEEKIGKKTGTDLCEGRLTLPIILALKRCKPEEIGVIKEALVANTLDAGAFSAVKDVIERYQTDASALEIARNFAARAKEEIVHFKPSLERDALMAIADYSVSRGE